MSVNTSEITALFQNIQNLQQSKRELEMRLLQASSELLEMKTKQHWHMFANAPGMKKTFFYSNIC